jgi:hypothetical protein
VFLKDFHFPFQVELSGNSFQTLGKRSFVLQSWNELVFRDNRIMFMEAGALLGVDGPGEADAGANVSFVFAGNHIHYANKVVFLYRDISTCVWPSYWGI